MMQLCKLFMRKVLSQVDDANFIFPIMSMVGYGNFWVFLFDFLEGQWHQNDCMKLAQSNEAVCRSINKTKVTQWDFSQ